MVNSNFTNILIIRNKNFYREVDLNLLHEEHIKIGNTDECSIKVKLPFRESIIIQLNKVNKSWQVEELENAHLTFNGIHGASKILNNGDQIIIKDKINKIELFRMNLFIDFLVSDENYDKVIPMNNIEEIRIGSDSDNEIIISDTFVDKAHCKVALDSSHNFYITDLNSRFGVFINGKKVEGRTYLCENDFIIICGYKFLFKNSCLCISKNNENIEIKGLNIYIKDVKDSLLKYPCLQRSPRIIEPLPQDDVEICEPPEKPSKPSNMIITSIIPLIGTVFMFLILNGQGIKYRLYSIGIMGISAVVSLIVYILQNNEYKKKYRMREIKYNEYLEKCNTDISILKSEQIRITNNMNPGESVCINRVNEFERELWERAKGDPDYLKVSLGKGKVPISFSIKGPKDTNNFDEDQLRKKANNLVKNNTSVDQCNITIDLKEDAPIGVIGKREYTTNFITSLLIKLTAQYSYEDIKIAFIFPVDELNKWKWLRWLPHVWDEKRDVRFLAYDKNSTHRVLNSIYSLIKDKSDAHYVIFFTDPSLIENEPIMPLIESNSSFGVSGIFLYDYIELIPKECKYIIEVNSPNEGVLRKIKNDSEKIKFVHENIEEYDMEEYSKHLAPVYVKNSFSHKLLPSHYTLFDMYNINNVNELNIDRLWNENKIYESMAVPLGINASGEIINLDIHEKSHGPHGLVAGTTGSGKSETLQTFLLSMAINFHPHDVTFIIIDYKGGGMANQLKDLPHLVGTITNLDGNKIARSLISIKSELKKRQRLFDKFEVNHINSYMKLYKAGIAKEPMPHLVIVADEFAELKHDQPDFMNELVTTARIGRSLGVHLILATQKPAGVVDNQIWSNSKFKLCLKVQDASDSNEIIKSPLAANIVEAGRCYFQVGNNEVFELFQSAWSGAKKYEDNDLNKKEIDIYEIGIDGTRKSLYSTNEENENKFSKTQLEIIVEEIKKVCSKRNITEIPCPWMPPLPTSITYDEVEKIGRSVRSDIYAVIGIIDMPKSQTQKPLLLKLEEGHTILFGAPTTGKTTLLQTVIISLIKRYSPEDINIYILDFGTMALKIFEDSNMVGGVVTANNEEMMNNFIKFIRKELNRRKEILSDMEVSSHAAYKEAGYKDLPNIVIIIDNFSACQELYPNNEDDFIVLSREGANLGISLLITSTNSSSIRYKMSVNLKTSFSLNCVDKSEYSNIFGRVPEILPESSKGRGLFKEDEIYEFQGALPVEGETEIERVSNIKKIIVNRNIKYKVKATKIPSVPEILMLSDIYNDPKFKKVDKGGIIPIGIDIEEIQLAFVDIFQNATLPIIGKSGMGKRNIMKVIISVLSKRDNISMMVINSSGYGLGGINRFKNISKILKNEEEIIDLFFDIDEELSKRRNILNDSINENLKEAPKFKNIVIFIDDFEEFIEITEKNTEIKNIVNSIVTKDYVLGINIVFACDENTISQHSYNLDYISNIRKNNFGIYLDKLENRRFFDVKLKFGYNEKYLSKGEGYIISNGFYSRVKFTKL